MKSPQPWLDVILREFVMVLWDTVLHCVGTYSNANTKNFAYRPPHIFHIETFA